MLDLHGVEWRVAASLGSCLLREEIERDRHTEGPLSQDDIVEMFSSEFSRLCIFTCEFVMGSDGLTASGIAFCVFPLR